ncbi:MAG: hypothetical protein M3Z37_03920, partial [Candidatus Eremiobacteraeota bacterium]|nr:hypothetical protein [Candidatus Eremiobacteraeota bacterium]
MLTGRFLLKCLPAFALLGAMLYAATRMSAGEPAPLALPMRSLLIRTVDVRFEHAGLHQQNSAAKSAYRPVDSTLLHDLSVAADGSIWIAPLFNGYQWGGVYERAVRYEPHAQTADVYKIARQKPQAIVVLPAPGGGVWVLDHAGFFGRYSPDGALTLAVAPDLGAIPRAAAVAANGDVWM